MHPRSVLKRTTRPLIGGVATVALALTGAVTMTAQAAEEDESPIVTVVQGDVDWAEQASECHTGATLTPKQYSEEGPERAPYGFSSHAFDISEYTSQTEIYRTWNYNGMPLQYLSRLEYSTYARPKTDGGPLRQPTYLRLTVDLGDSAGEDLRLPPADGPTELYFVPANNENQHEVVNFAWQTWDAGNGRWSVDSDKGVEGTVTLKGLLNEYPDAALVYDQEEEDAAQGSIALITGCGLGGDTDSQRNGFYNVDRLIVGADSNDVLYDFEDGESGETDGGTDPVTIDPDNNGETWYSVAYDWDTQRSLHTNQTYVAGADTPPEGVGSLRATLSDDVNPQRVEQYVTQRYDGKLLRDLRHLTYSTYATQNDPYWDGPQQPNYMFLRIDKDDDGYVDDILVYYPQNNGEVTNYEWQNWHALAGDWNLNGDGDDSDTFSIDSYLVANPNARISAGYLDRQARMMADRPVYGLGGLGFQAGGGGDEQLNGDYFLDNIEIAAVDTEDPTSVVGTNYDLEPYIPVPQVNVGDSAVTEINPVTAPKACVKAAGARTPLACGGAEEWFKLSLSEPTLVPVTVSYATADGSAKAGTDYLAQSGDVTFEPGSTSTLVSVPVVADKQFERAENFSLLLSNPASATLGDSVGNGRIRNDDTAVTLNSSNVGNRQVQVSGSTHWEAKGSRVQIYRVMDGPNPVLLDTSLDSNGVLASTVLARTFAHGVRVGLYAVVTTDMGDYRSPRARLVIP